MKKLKKVRKYPKTNPKKRLVLLSLRRKPKKRSKKFPSSIKNITNMMSPHNTTQFLMSNNSGTFLSEEDDISLDLSPDPYFPLLERNSELMKIENQNLSMKDTNLELELASTAEQSKEFNESKLSYE